MEPIDRVGRNSFKYVEQILSRVDLESIPDGTSPWCRFIHSGILGYTSSGRLRDSLSERQQQTVKTTPNRDRRMVSAMSVTSSVPGLPVILVRPVTIQRSYIDVLRSMSRIRSERRYSG